MFSAPDWNAAIDLNARIAAVPATALARGMFFQFVFDAVGPKVAARIGKQRRYVGFKNYPLRELVELNAIACSEGYPGVPPRQALRQMAAITYPKLATTMVGTAIFAVAGRNFRRTIELAARAYQVSMSPCSVNMREISDGHAIVELRQIWNFADCTHVGIWEGTMQACDVSGEVKLQVNSIDSVDLELRWG